MSRQKITLPSTDDAEEIPGVVDDIRDLIDDAGANAGLKIRVFRKVRTAGNSKVILAFCGGFERMIDMQDVGENFGPGEYQINFRWRDKTGTRQETTRSWIIGQEFAKYTCDTSSSEEGAAGALAGTPGTPAAVPAPAPAPAPAGGLLGSLVGNLNAEKITAGLAILDAVKKFLAPPPPPDYTKLFELMLANQRGQTVGDTVVIEALKQANKPAAPAPTVIDQINNLKAVRDAFAGDFAGGEHKQRGSDKMDTLIEMGLKYLPDLLAKHNNNYKAVGAEVAQMNFVQNLIKSDPELTSNFFAVAADKYGRDAAMQLANGFGVQIDFNEGEAAQQPPQIAQQPAQDDAPAAQNGGLTNG